ncbi:MAG: O-antigen ligase family protein [Proteobacteria bacterium]|nr:O-antigen ligase family protein [Pseudomonadota bacterium]
MFHVGLLCCLGIGVLEGLLSPRRRKRPIDRTIRNAVFVYYAFIFLSVGLADYDRLPTKIYTLLDYSLLFFLCLHCVKERKDAMTLLKGTIFAGVLMGALGVIGYALDDPWWGQMVHDDKGAQLARVDSSLSYGEKWDIAMEHNKKMEIVKLRTRVKSTAGSPNDLGTMLVMVFPLLMFFWFRTKSKRYKPLLAGLFAIVIIGVILTGSRTAFVAGAAAFFIMAVGLIRTRRVKVSAFQYVIVIALVVSLAAVVGRSQYFGRFTQQRLSAVSDLENFLEVEGRMSRWKYAVENLDPTYLVIGCGYPGASGRKGSHNTYLSTIYKAGIWACLAFCICLLRTMRNTLRLEDRLMGISFFAILVTFALSGITQESTMAIGPGYIFWPVAAILANRSIAPFRVAADSVSKTDGEKEESNR